MFKTSEFQSCFSFWIKPESAWFNVLPIPMWCALCIHRRKDIYTKRKETPIWDGNVWMKELSEWIRLILFHLVDFENVIVWKSLYVRLQSLFWIIQGSMWNHFLVMTSYSPPLCLCLQNTCMIIACAEFLDEKCTYSTKKKACLQTNLDI